jgi:hypothetical protein
MLVFPSVFVLLATVPSFYSQVLRIKRNDVNSFRQFQDVEKAIITGLKIDYLQFINSAI